MRNNLSINDHKKLLKDLGQQKYNKEILSRYEKLKSSNAVNFTFKDTKGILYALKDNYAVKDSVVSASTRILESHNPRYNSTVYKLLKNKDFNPLFISNMDELAMGGKGIYSKRKPVQNSFDKKLISGGSSSGSAFLVGSNIVPFAIGSDTGDSVIKPSALNRIIGFKPTWSSVSRYGLYDYSPAFDHVGWFTNNVDDSILLANDLIKKDNKDQSNTKHPSDKFSSDKSKIKKVAVIKDLEKFITDSDIRKNYLNTINLFKREGIEIVEVNFSKNILESIPFIYQIITYTESMSSNSNLSGIGFGDKNKGENYKEIIKNSRDFNLNTKARFLVGMFSMYQENMEDIFIYAKKLRTLFINDFKRIIKDVDSLIIPTIMDKPESIKEAVENSYKKPDFGYLSELNQIGNITGCPSLSIPVGKDEEFTSITIFGNVFDENSVFSTAKVIEGK